MSHVASRIDRRRGVSRRLALTPRPLFALPPLGGYRVTPRRRLTLYLNRFEYLRGRTRLRSYPTRLVVEPASACNLRCPYCLTGAGAVGRPRVVMTLDLYHQLLHELGDFLFEIELFQWGEPLLSPSSAEVVSVSVRASGRHELLRRARAAGATLVDFVKLPDDVRGYRLTWKRLANLYLNRYEVRSVRPVLRSRPSRPVIEPTNVCNLRCPHCHTGAGRFGRRPAMMGLACYLKLLDEIGDYLLLIEVFNWGESMLHPDLPAIVAAASARGIATRVNTNLSIPFTMHDAERLVESGLTELFVSIDGATQEVYERYRVGGDLAKVIRNCQLVAEAKRRLGKELPHLTLQLLQFPCNADEGEGMRQLAAALDMRLLAFRGAAPDPEWARQSGWPPWFLSHAPRPCPFLWGQPVLTVEGNLAPCRGVFQSFDDFTHLAAGPAEGGAQSFQEAWNHERYRAARGLFRRRSGSPAERRLPCYECPTTVFYERWRTHRAAGGTLETFEPGVPLNANGAWNYFWARGQLSAAPSDDAG